jgi:hypothetical protein
MPPNDPPRDLHRGHATIAMVRKYAGEARQIMLAKSAKKKRDGG